MKFNDELLKLLNKKHEPDTMVDMRYKTYDLSFKTDKDGNAILLFMGKRTEQGTVKGERYARTLKYKPDGTILKDHWELKGNAT
ncbi:MAG: hypothetical protein K0S09_3014 [Sphingobacteriaceae bacterium]|jgi:hypothetical protein|nr:hypothetical protein [Sphingobacteriaceae bacterium]